MEMLTFSGNKVISDESGDSIETAVGRAIRIAAGSDTLEWLSAPAPANAPEPVLAPEPTFVTTGSIEYTSDGKFWWTHNLCSKMRSF